jgi:hypothetical protein
MPWHISNKKEGCSGYAVVKDDDGEIVGCHKTEEDAKNQLAALYASEANSTSKSYSIWNGFFDPKN